ncbi:MAG TPA: serine/threonine-protein kinase, partial [Planctomycetota bacterium]
MNSRLRWKTAAAEGSVPLPGRLLHLLLTEDGLDQVSQAPGAASGLSVQPADDKGRLGLKASGDLVFTSGEKDFRRVLLPVGGGVSFRAGEMSGSLRVAGEPAAEDPNIGRKLGGYELRARLGAGAVGVVYRALQTSLDREVALKVLDPKFAKEPLKVASFKREAVAAGRLSHPNLVQVYDVDGAEGLYFFSMELVGGGTLEDLLKKNGPLPWRDAIDAVRESALALAYAEEHHLVHRDVKPENLMVADSGHVKLADLGLAATRGLIDKEAAGGTPHFMAPENLGGKVDHRSDLYSLGCTLYRLLTGQTPFEGADVREILRAHRDVPPPTAKQGGANVPKGVEELLASLLAKDPDQRPAHASDVVEWCQTILRGSESRRLVVGLAALLLMAGGGLAWQATRPEKEATPEIVEVIRADPGRAELEMQLDRERIAREYAESLAAGAPADRLAALEAFLERNPQAPQAAEARAESARIRAELTAGANADALVAEARRARESRLRKEIDAPLAQGAFARALGVARGADWAEDDLRAAGEARVLAAADVALSAWEGEHKALLALEDWRGALALREAVTTSIAVPGGAGPVSWAARLAGLTDAAVEAEHRAEVRAFDAARSALLASLKGDVRPALPRVNARRAADAYAAAAAACELPALQQVVARETPVFEAAARASAALRRRLESGEEVVIVEPLSGKRAQATGATPEGLQVRVQVRGERVERLDPWQAYFEPEAFSGLLRAALPADVADQDVCALYLLVGEAELARSLREFGTALPTSAQAAAWAG